jgi:hypothetical protein
VGSSSIIDADTLIEPLEVLIGFPMVTTDTRQFTFCELKMIPHHLGSTIMCSKSLYSAAGVILLK